MPVTKPEDMAQAFAEAFNSGNIESVLALYESNAVMVPEAGKLAKGPAALRETLTGFLTIKGKITIQSRYCIHAGDLALTSLDWSLRGSGPNGQPMEMQGTSMEVIRRQSDGRWLYIIGHPYGAD
jgi:ketosteroid isomerase-like protein